jgi:hypothetical protein
MSGGMGGFGIGGVGAERATFESEILWGADQARNAVLWQSATISGAARDAGNTPTTVLRPGLLMGKITSGGKYIEWTPAATDGSQNLAGILDIELRAQDFDATNQDRSFRVLAARGPVKARKLLILGAAFVGHADEFLARRQLAAAGFVLDDDPFGYLAGTARRTLVKAVDYTVADSDNGTLFSTRGAAGAVNFTLPAIKRGLEFSFFNEVGQNMTITAGTADTLVVFNDLAADSIAFSTANELIGGAVTVRANDNASKWLVFVNLGAETQTPTIAT